MDQDTSRFLLRETVTEVLPRRLETTFGLVDLKVPRDREGQYYPALALRPPPGGRGGGGRSPRSARRPR